MYDRSHTPPMLSPFPNESTSPQCTLVATTLRCSGVRTMVPFGNCAGTSTGCPVLSVRGTSR